MEKNQKLKNSQKILNYMNNKMSLINKSQIKARIKELDKEDSIGSVSENLGIALERKVDEILDNAIKRAKANKRRTLQERDL